MKTDALKLKPQDGDLQRAMEADSVRPAERLREAMDKAQHSADFLVSDLYAALAAAEDSPMALLIVDEITKAASVLHRIQQIRTYAPAVKP